MAAETYLLLTNQLLTRNNPSVVISAGASAGSVTDNGYNEQCIVKPNFATSWKAPNGTNDNYIAINGGSAGWLGTTAGDRVFFALAYDARGSHQNTITLNSDSTDNPAGTFTQVKATITTVKTAPCVFIASFLLPAGGKQYYRIQLTNANRSGGTILPKLYYAGMYRVSAGDDALRLMTDRNQPTAPGMLEQFGRNGVVEASSMEVYSNKNGSPGQTVEVALKPSRETVWTILRDALYGMNVAQEAFFVQFEGLKNADTANCGLVRVASNKWGSTRQYDAEYDTILYLNTEAQPL